MHKGRPITEDAFHRQFAEAWGLEFVLRALKIVQITFQVLVAFDIVGDGPDRTRLERLMQELSIQNVPFGGAQQSRDIAPFFKGSDFFCHPFMISLVS